VRRLRWLREAAAAQREDEDASSADIFRDLRMRKSKHQLEPLFKGEWE